MEKEKYQRMIRDGGDGGGSMAHNDNMATKAKLIAQIMTLTIWTTQNMFMCYRERMRVCECQAHNAFSSFAPG